MIRLCYTYRVMDKDCKKLTVSAEDYLEAALRLNIRGERIKVTGIAELLGVSKPAVTNALGELAAKGLLLKEPYGDIVLTDAGKTAAEAIYGKHKLLSDFLQKLGVSPKVAEIDCCKIEHVLSEETLERIKDFTETR